MKLIHLLGGRIIKTGVAVFLTAIICFAFNWSPVFAVITAIVTLEPTVSDSIKKGIVRFPASVIGSGYAVILIALFGNSAITYTLAAVLTIATCYKLNLHAGLLVATLTAVTMVEVIDSNYVLAFFTRLGTTSIGLLVSTGVNMFVLPPDYAESIVSNINNLKRQIGKNINKTFTYLLVSESEIDEKLIKKLSKVRKKLRKTEQLILFQKDEAKYHPLVGQEKEQFIKSEIQLAWLRTLHYHLENLSRASIENLTWSHQDRTIIFEAAKKLGDRLQTDIPLQQKTYEEQLRRITAIFWKYNKKLTGRQETDLMKFPGELIIMYELVTMYNTAQRFYEDEGIEVK